MRLISSIGIVLIVLVLQSYCQQNQDQTFGPTQQNLDLVSRSVTNLAQKISLAIASPKSKTELFSPVSIAGALSLLLLGSGGATRDELINVLGLQGPEISFADIHKSFGRLFQELVSNEPSMTARIPWRENDKCTNPDYDDEDDYQPPPRPVNNRLGNPGKQDADSHYISVANGVFIDENIHINPFYENLTKELYAGEISWMPLLRSPVQASHRINLWVQQATKNKIREIVAPEQVSNSPMVLASALYFKAKWETMFMKLETRPRPFYINGRESPPVDIETMATSGCFPYYEVDQLNVKIVGLPYLAEKSTMYIVMPNQSDRQKIRNLQNILQVNQLNEFIDRMTVKTGTIMLPKMNLENTIGLREVLASQGLQTIFSPLSSNLTEINKNSRIFENTVRSTSRPTQPKPSSKPTHTTRRPNYPEQINTNQRPSVPGNSESQTPQIAIQPLSPSNPTQTTSRPNETEQFNINQRPPVAWNSEPQTPQVAIQSQPSSMPTQATQRPNYQEQLNTNQRPPVMEHSQSQSPHIAIQPLPPLNPTQTTQRSNYPEQFNTNQRLPIPGNSESQIPLPQIKPVLVSEVTTTVQPIQVGLYENECNLTNNCIYDGYSCKYYPSRPIYTDDKGCYPRPWIIQQNCHPERRVLTDWLCLADSHIKYTVREGQCAWPCAQLNDMCYCCNAPGAATLAPPTLQRTAIPPTTTDTNSNNAFAIANRLNAISTHAPTRVCQISQTCNRFGCQKNTICALVNYDGTPLAGNVVQRNKRQVQSNSPTSNLYVGNILHKVSLDINEEGTEGGAVTAVLVDRISSSFNMRMDGPFIIYLRNDVTKLPLFYGAVFDPRS